MEYSDSVTDPATLHYSSLEQMMLSIPMVKRLLAASLCGGVIGLEREWRHKDSGLRTNMLICMGSALFTVMSIVLAGDSTPNKGQVAANIVQGVGFLGAGLILHGKNRVMGLTTAASVFVVAAIGMTCGAGLYLVAFCSTVLLLLALQSIGAMESKLGWKRYPMIYEVRAAMDATVTDDATPSRLLARLRMQQAVLEVLDRAKLRLMSQQQDSIAGYERLSFEVVAKRSLHQCLLRDLQASDATDMVAVFRDPEEE